ncbi:MAG: beta strand repeat-containing protein [Acidimicrobiia bacterium]
MDAKRGISRLAAGLLTAIVATGGLVALAGVTAGAANITTTGPLTNIGVSPDLNCSANHVGDTSGEFFADIYCGTFVTVDGTLYEPFALGSASEQTWTPVSQTGPTGAGTDADPYTIVTVADAGTTGVRVTQTDTYTTGLESFRTDVRVSNSSGVAKDVRVFRAADCYLQNSDAGYGAVDGTTGAVACTTGLEAGSRIEQWFPITSGSHYYESFYGSVWSAVASQAAFPDTCDCTTFQDNGAGLSWDGSIASGGNKTFSSFITFSPLGLLPLSLTVTPDATSVAAGGTVGYTIGVANPNGSAVSLTAIADAIPASFSYVAGSSTGLTTADPTIGAGNTLTWSGPLAVPGNGSASLHFTANVGSTSGTFTSSVTATNDTGYTVAPTGPDGAVTVTSGANPLVISLAPTSASAAVGSSPTVTAHVTRGGADVAGLPVLLATLSGPNAGALQGGLTDASGLATFTLTSTVPGTDLVRAASSDSGTPVSSNDATVTWTAGTGGALTVVGSANPATVTTGSNGQGHYTITNPGEGAVTGVFAIVTVGAGATPVSATAAPGGCGQFSGNQTICLVGTIAPGATATIDVVAGTGSLPAGSTLSTALDVRASGSDPIPGSESADVVAPAPGEAQGFVAPGGTISTGTTATPENNTVASFQLPSTGSGAPIVLRTETAGAGTFCGGSPSSGKILFLSPFTGYTDPRRPARLHITWDKTVAGAGTHSSLYVQKVEGGPIVIVPTCRDTDHHVAIPSPCIHEREKLSSGDIRFEVVLLSGDPRFARR